MESPIHRLLLPFVVLFGWPFFSFAQDAPIILDDPAPATQKAEDTGAEETVQPEGTPNASSQPIRLEITRRTIENFLTDPLALLPFGGDSESPAPLISTFVVAAEGTPFSAIWDPTACRLLGVYRTPDPAAAPSEGDPPSPYVLLAEGPSPLSTSMGAFGSPSYFGFRLVDGYPEFLYQFGRLLIEERLWFDSEKNALMQQFTVKNPTNSIGLKLPESWKARAEASAGEWKETLLTVPADKVEADRTSFVIAYSLTDEE